MPLSVEVFNGNAGDCATVSAQKIVAKTAGLKINKLLKITLEGRTIKILDAGGIILPEVLPA
ncbi:MAG: hypothetical protein PHV82_08555 [Victivallaceae bacterium]|nr:hypothetical protein [Victivallaceae bacterium]